MKHERYETLGAIPKRRSPQQVALGIKGDGIEMFVRIKTGKRNLNVDKEHKEIVRKIIGHGNVEKTKRNLKAVKAHLLQNKANSKESIFEYPLIAAIEDGEVEIVKWLLEHNDVQINR